MVVVVAEEEEEVEIEEEKKKEPEVRWGAKLEEHSRVALSSREMCSH